MNKSLAMKQWENLKSKVEGCGVKVEELSQVQGLPDMVFCCNAGLVVGQKVKLVFLQLLCGVISSASFDVLRCICLIFGIQKDKENVSTILTGSNQPDSRCSETNQLTLRVVEIRFSPALISCGLGTDSGELNRLNESLSRIVNH